jgi:hypothetical protein
VLNVEIYFIMHKPQNEVNYLVSEGFGSTDLKVKKGRRDFAFELRRIVTHRDKQENR